MEQSMNQGGVSTLGRMLLLDQRFYSVHVGAPKNALDTEKAKRFFDSFKIDSTYLNKIVQIQCQVDPHTSHWS